MKLKDLLKDIELLGGNCSLETEVAGVQFDSRKVSEKDVFVCLAGTRTDGNSFICDALKNGACVVVSQRDFESDIPYIKVDNTRKALSLLARNLYGNPLDGIKLITVVGTNGKTSTAYIVKEILRLNGFKTGFIGTVGVDIGSEHFASDMTTPDPIEMNELFRKMKEAGVEVVVMELSAHAIFYQKLYGVKSDVTIFTNITQDHLDFFKTIENYANTKLSYFNKDFCKKAIVNVDCEYGRKILFNSDCDCVTYGMKNPSDIFAIDEKFRSDGATFVVNLNDEIIKIDTNFLGEFNLYNTLAGIITANEMGVSLSNIAKSLRIIKPVSGRFNVIIRNKKRIIIDYAHTPDGLENILREAKKRTLTKLIVVFGCGGDRDVFKRPLMGAIAEKYCDAIILSEDNSRFELTSNIIKDIKKGITHLDKVCIEEDRAKAIKKAYAMCEGDDIVVVAGKGSEDYIEKNGTKLPYSDYAVISQLED